MNTPVFRAGFVYKAIMANFSWVIEDQGIGHKGGDSCFFCQTCQRLWQTDSKAFDGTSPLLWLKKDIMVAAARLAHISGYLSN